MLKDQWASLMYIPERNLFTGAFQVGGDWRVESTVHKNSSGV